MASLSKSYPSQCKSSDSRAVACPKSAPNTLAFPPHPISYSTKLTKSYPIIFQLMDFLVPGVPKQLIMQHHVLPCDCLVKFELYLVHLVFRLHVDKKVCVVENRIHQQVWRILCVINLACWRLDELVMKHSSFSPLQQHPAVNSLA